MLIYLLKGLKYVYDLYFFLYIFFVYKVYKMFFGSLLIIFCVCVCNDFGFFFVFLGGFGKVDLLLRIG